MRYEKEKKGGPSIGINPKTPKPESQPYSPVSPTSFFKPHPFQLMCRAAACGSCSVPFHALCDCRTRSFGSPVSVCARALMYKPLPARPQAQSCAWSPSRSQSREHGSGRRGLDQRRGRGRCEHGHGLMMPPSRVGLFPQIPPLQPVHDGAGPLDGVALFK